MTDLTRLSLFEMVLPGDSSLVKKRPGLSQPGIVPPSPPMHEFMFVLGKHSGKARQSVKKAIRRGTLLMAFHVHVKYRQIIVTSLITLTRLADGFGRESRPTLELLAATPLIHPKNHDPQQASAEHLWFPRFPIPETQRLKIGSILSFHECILRSIKHDVKRLKPMLRQ